MEKEKILAKIDALIADETFEKSEKYRKVLEVIAEFYVDFFRTEEDEVAIFFPNKLNTSLRFVYPFYLTESDEIPVNSSKPIVSKIFRSGLSFLENNLVNKERLYQYEFIKNYDNEAKIIWKMVGTVIKFNNRKIGVVQVCRKRAPYKEVGEDFNLNQLNFIEESISKFAPYLDQIQKL